MIALRILVVEDEPVISMLLAEVLVGMGHAVCGVAATEADAITAAERVRPDFMVIDAHLRDGNGLDAATAILRTRFVPHLFITGDRPAVQRLVKAAVVIEKPFSAAVLERGIERAWRATAPERLGVTLDPHVSFQPI